MTTLQAPVATAHSADRPKTTAPSAHELRLPMTYEEYLTKVDENKHAEWVDGEAIIFRSKSFRRRASIATAAISLTNMKPPACASIGWSTPGPEKSGLTFGC